jgi:hypothetical protein
VGASSTHGGTNEGARRVARRQHPVEDDVTQPDFGGFVGNERATSPTETDRNQAPADVTQIAI